jgi:hypothetical protein
MSKKYLVNIKTKITKMVYNNHFESYENDRWYPDTDKHERSDRTDVSDRIYSSDDEYESNKKQETMQRKQEKTLINIIEYYRSIDDRFQYVDLSHVFKNYCNIIVLKNNDNLIDDFAEDIVSVLFPKETTNWVKSVKKQIISNVIETIDRHYIY